MSPRPIDALVGLLAVLAGYGMILGMAPVSGVATWNVALVLVCAFGAITGGGIVCCLYCGRIGEKA